jgi:folate-binding protein YgfZ
MSDLRIRQDQQGAVRDGAGVPQHYGNALDAYQAAQTGVALVDRSHWGRIEVGDADRLRFLHNQSTNRFQSRQPGEGCETVFLTSTARMIDLALALVLDETVLLLVSSPCRQDLLDRLDRYIFFSDKVSLGDRTADLACFSLIGPSSDALLEQLVASSLADLSTHHHRLVSIRDIPVRVVRGSGLGLGGYTLLMQTEQAGELWSLLSDAGAIPSGEQTWERLRIEAGRPAVGQELTEDYNPLEAGLWHTLSFDKGCYIGQETIARLNTYKGVKLRLYGVRLSQSVAIGTPLLQGEEKAGVVTSVVATDQGTRGLAYVRTKVGGEGLVLQAGDAEATVVTVPFLDHTYYEPMAAQV